MEFDSDSNEIVFVGPIMETDERNIIDHTTSMASRPPNVQKEIELIHAWINNPHADPLQMIDWPAIGVSPINEYVTLGLLDMAFPALFADGISVILVGDLNQLPLVRDRPAYDSNRRAKLLLEDFKIVVTLEKIFRQDGEEIQQKQFHELLTNMREAHPTINDWKLLMSRTNSNLTAPMNEEFDNNIHLFSTNDNVYNHNRKKLYLLKQPMARSVATKSRNVSAMEGSWQDELDMELLISKNARVMLTTNLWIEVGLVNGALGYVENIVYKPGSMPLEPPTYVMVKFDTYSGIPFDAQIPQTVPISATHRGSTTHIPLRLAWAMTIHKSQGLTLEKATIDIGPTERT
ncbi:uncharacterized protein LOC131858643 [Cryptomeria japonica]|uniref:uncharacterized protein LOC131858643 n=1 Tax=Cryptomeria japonica TaxID=3369 RepID=UPI0027DA9612|nr:uncharacterized protein LOC131858643 [Cryptomeria japonica]